MDANTAFASLDGEALIVPQLGALNITTELGKLLVRAGEIVVIPCGLRYRVQLVNNAPSRGYIRELYECHYRLPELGIMGTSGAAHIRDFQVPLAYFDGTTVELDGTKVATTSSTNWNIISRLNYKLYACTQDHTPFDVADWNGTLYPYKYDLGRFNYLANVHYDHKDPSAHTVLTTQAYGKAPNTAVVDFIVFGKRHEAALDTHRLPWYHRNTMNELTYAIFAAPPPENVNEMPGMGGFSVGAVTAHWPADEDYRALQEIDGMTTVLAMDGPITIAMFETECLLYFTEWALDMAKENEEMKVRMVAQ